MTDLGTAPGDRCSTANSINDHGQVVGNARPTVYGRPQPGTALGSGGGALPALTCPSSGRSPLFVVASGPRSLCPHPALGGEGKGSQVVGTLGELHPGDCCRHLVEAGVGVRLLVRERLLPGGRLRGPDRGGFQCGWLRRNSPWAAKTPSRQARTPRKLSEILRPRWKLRTVPSKGVRRDPLAPGRPRWSLPGPESSAPVASRPASSL
jgi:hypothetical protein